MTRIQQHRSNEWGNIKVFVCLSLMALVSQLRLFSTVVYRIEWDGNSHSGNEFEIIVAANISSGRISRDDTSNRKLTAEENQITMWRAASEELRRTKSWKNESTFITVDRNVYASVVKKARIEVRSVVDTVFTECELYILPPPPNNVTHNTKKPHLRFRCSSSENGNESNDLEESPCRAANLCRVVVDPKTWGIQTNEGDSNEKAGNNNKTALLMMVDGMDYLTRPEIWQATLNKASYAHRSGRQLFLWIGYIDQSELHKRNTETLGPAFGFRCIEKTLNNTIHYFKPLALMALLETFPSTHSVLFLDADTAFCKRSFDHLDEFGPETYLEISPQASLVGSQNGGGKMLMNSGTIILKNTRWARDFLALWWYGRCGHKDQLALWNILYATWSAWTTLCTDEAASSTSDVEHWAYPGQFFFGYNGAMAKLFMNFRRYGPGIQSGWDAVEKRHRRLRGDGPTIHDDYEYPVPTNTSLFNGGKRPLRPKFYAPMELPHVLILPPSVPVAYFNHVGAQMELPLLAAVQPKENNACTAQDVFAVHSKSLNSCSNGECWPFLPKSSAMDSIRGVTNQTMAAINYDKETDLARNNNRTITLAAKGEAGINGSASILLHDDWVKDIGFKVLGCGVYKCAFRSKRSRNYGYLVAPILEKDNMKIHNDTFTMAHNLKRDFGIEHSLLSPPVEVLEKNAPSWLLAALGKHTEVPNKQEWRNRKNQWISSSDGSRSILVQPIALYSPQSILFKCNVHKRIQKNWRIEDFNATTFVSNDDEDSRDNQYADRFRRDLSSTTALLDSSSKWSSCLSKDFQIAIDPTRGRLVHIDLDRCFGKNTMHRSWRGGCRNTLAGLIERIIAQRQKVLSRRDEVSTPKKSN